MGKIIKKLITCVTVLSMVVTMAALPARPAMAEESCGDTATFFDWGCSSGENAIFDILTTVLNWVAGGVTVIVLIGIIYGAITYATAGGNEANAKKGITIIRNSVIALVLYFAMYSLLNFLIPGGLFT